MSFRVNTSRSDDRGRLLQNTSPSYHDSPDYSSASTLVNPRSPNSPPQARQRPGYARLASLSPKEQSPARFNESHDGDIGMSSEHSHGLGISSSNGKSPELGDEEEHDRFVSGGSIRSIPFSFASSMRALNDEPRSFHKAKTSDYDLPSGASVRSRKSYANFTPHMYCASREQIWKGARHHVYITLLVLGTFSTIFSGIYVGIAVARPRYGHFISDDGNLTYSNATLLFALFAKLIELSFVTVFIAFIGQVISRRAFNRSKGYGVTLAEISMRGWVMQPGQMLTHPSAVKYAIVSLMGFIALAAALTAMLYTTAASALVTPQLSLSHPANVVMRGAVSRAFADMTNYTDNCASPVQNDYMGFTTKQQTCIGPLMSGQTNNDLATWLGNWTHFANTTRGSNDLRDRPPAYSLIGDMKISVKAPWIEIQNMTVLSNEFNRTINNVSMAMPHAGVIDAALSKENKLLQPKANDGFGAYNIHASVPSPAVNVICAEMSRQELAPLVYSEWPNANKSFDPSEWNNNLAPWPGNIPSYGNNEWLNRTIVDQIFGFGPEFGQRRPPVFPILPTVFNTLINQTGAWAPLPYRDSIYVLGGNPDTQGNVKSYSLCALRAYRTPNCSTWYNATSSSSRMEAVCEQDQDDYQYSKHAAPVDLKRGNETTSLLWVDMGGSSISAASLGQGLAAGDAADARLLTQFFPTTRELNATMPSMAEALAVMVGNTLLAGSRNSPVTTMVDDGQPMTGPLNQTFRAQLQTQVYASGAVQKYQNLFFIVLFAVFGGNVLVLMWLILNRGLVTDFCDPANMFSLTINSPPSHIFAGSCGGGPAGKQYEAKWFLNVDGDHVFIENDEQESELAENRAKSKQSPASPVAPSPIMQTYSKLSQRKSIL